MFVYPSVNIDIEPCDFAASPHPLLLLLYSHACFVSFCLSRLKLFGHPHLSYTLAFCCVRVHVCVTLLAGTCVYHVRIMSGISESAGVALAMFVVHVATLTVVCLTSAFYAFFNVNTLQDNLKQVRYARWCNVNLNRVLLYHQLKADAAVVSTCNRYWVVIFKQMLVQHQLEADAVSSP